MDSSLFTPNLTRSASQTSWCGFSKPVGNNGSVYMNLVNFLVALRRLPPLGNLTGDEERLLFELKALENSGKDLTVAHVYALLVAKSGSTSYRNLANLKEKGLVSISSDPSDGRKRLISFTPEAESLFDALSG